MKCPNCQHANRKSAKFCEECGGGMSDKRTWQPTLQTLQAIINTLPEPIYLKDAAGNYVVVNERMAEDHGMTVEEFRGFPTAKLPGRSRDEIQTILKADREVIEGGRRVDIEDIEVHLAGDRTGWQRMVKVPLRGEDGEIFGIVGLAEDTTERKHAEEKLRESERRLRKMIDASSLGMYIHDHYRFLYANQVFSELFGYAGPDELLAAGGPERLLAPGERERLQKFYEARTAGEPSPDRYEYKGLRKDGAQIWLESFVQIVDWEGREAVLSAVMDISERKQAEVALVQAKEQAEEATSLKDKFVSLIAHDLRSPIGTVLGMMSFFKPGQSVLDEDKQLDLYDRAVIRLEGLVGLIEEVLDIGRLQTGQMELNKQAHPALELILNALTLRPVADAKGVKLVNEVPQELVLTADATYFGQVIQNLVANAIKFCNAGDTVTIYVPEGSPATIAVRDTGVGIPESMLPNLFGYEVKTTTPGTANEIGTGLGLPLSHEIMKAHGGKLYAESKEGQGSVFYAELPA